RRAARSSSWPGAGPNFSTGCARPASIRRFTRSASFRRFVRRSRPACATGAKPRCRPTENSAGARTTWTSSMATLHFICGKAASGKTTLARRLATQHRAAPLIEEEWLTLLGAEIVSLADYGRHSGRLRAALVPHAIRLLELGTSIVLDFAGNTPKERAWVRG